MQEDGQGKTLTSPSVQEACCYLSKLASVFFFTTPVVERITGIEPSSETMPLRYLKLMVHILLMFKVLLKYDSEAVL